jgi:hypothetical protein
MVQRPGQVGEVEEALTTLDAPTPPLAIRVHAARSSIRPWRSTAVSMANLDRPTRRSSRSPHGDPGTPLDRAMY